MDEDKMDGACSIHGEINAHTSVAGESEGKISLENFGLGGSNKS